MDLMLVYRAYTQATPSRKPSMRRSMIDVFITWLIERRVEEAKKKPQLMKKVGEEVLPFFRQLAM